MNAACLACPECEDANDTLPPLVSARLVEAIVYPSIPRWRSLSHFARATIEAGVDPMMEPRLRRVMDFATRQMISLQPKD